MRILISNDDGINAPGLACLETMAAEISDDVWVVAPETEQSGKGHAVSLRTPVRLRQISERRFAVDGTPGDCVMMGLRHVIEGPVDLVLSGVNRGSNVADDVTYSGTVAAAMEATLLGVPAIAMSQDYRERLVHWDTPRSHGPDLIRQLVADGWPRGVLININFPAVEPGDVAGISHCRLGQHDFTTQKPVQRTDPFGHDYFWMAGWAWGTEPAPAGTDLRALQENRIAVTPISLDMTHESTLQDFAKAQA
jgi:5'-nucleotidase